VDELEAEEAFGEFVAEADEEMDAEIADVQEDMRKVFTKWLAVSAAGGAWAYFGSLERALQKLTDPPAAKLGKVLTRSGAKVGRVAVTTIVDAFGLRSQSLGRTPADLRIDKARIIQSGQASLVPLYDAASKKYGGRLFEDLQTLIAEDVRRGAHVSETIRKVAGALQREPATKGEAADLLARAMADRFRTRSETYVLTELASARAEMQLDAIRELARHDSDIRQQWVVYANCCGDCQTVADEVVGVGQPFSNGKPSPPAHPRCRCSLRATRASWGKEE